MNTPSLPFSCFRIDRFTLSFCRCLALLLLALLSPTPLHALDNHGQLRVVVVVAKYKDTEDPAMTSEMWATELNQQMPAYFNEATEGQTTFSFEPVPGILEFNYTYEDTNPQGGEENFARLISNGSFTQDNDIAVMLREVTDASKYAQEQVNADRDQVRLMVVVNRKKRARATPRSIVIGDGFASFLISKAPDQAALLPRDLALTAHELAHTVDLPDLYAESGASMPVELWCLMGWDNFQHFGAFSRITGQWLNAAQEQIINPSATPVEVVISPPVSTPHRDRLEVVRLQPFGFGLPGADNEEVLLEIRARRTLDEPREKIGKWRPHRLGLPDLYEEGLLISRAKSYFGYSATAGAFQSSMLGFPILNVVPKQREVINDHWVVGVRIISRGSSYTETPQVVIGPPRTAGGRQALAEATLVNGQISDVTMIDIGSGYDRDHPPAVSFVRPGHTGDEAVGEAVMTSVEEGSRGPTLELHQAAFRPGDTHEFPEKNLQIKVLQSLPSDPAGSMRVRITYTAGLYPDVHMTRMWLDNPANGFGTFMTGAPDASGAPPLFGDMVFQRWRVPFTTIAGVPVPLPPVPVETDHSVTCRVQNSGAVTAVDVRGTLYFLRPEALLTPELLTDPWKVLSEQVLGSQTIFFGDILPNQTRDMRVEVPLSGPVTFFLLLDPASGSAQESAERALWNNGGIGSFIVGQVAPGSPYSPATLNLDLTNVNQKGHLLCAAIQSLPEGWTGRVTGPQGVPAAGVGSGDSATFTITVQPPLPEVAKPGVIGEIQVLGLMDHGCSVVPITELPVYVMLANDTRLDLALLSVGGGVANLRATLHDKSSGQFLPLGGQPVALTVSDSAGDEQVLSGVTSTASGQVGRIDFTASLDATRHHAAVASFAGSTTYRAAVSPMVSVEGNKAQIPVVSGPSTRNVAVGQEFSFQISATHSPVHHAASGLPPGLEVDPANGQITGAPLAPGIYRVALSAANQHGEGRNDLIINVGRAGQKIVLPAISPKATDHPPFLVDVSATSGLPVQLQVLSGPALVQGRTLTLQGLPGTVVLMASQAGNDDVEPATAQISFDVGYLPVITSPAEVDGTVGGTLRFEIIASDDPTGFSVGSLPPGLGYVFEAGKGVIRGTPAMAGDYSVTVRPVNSFGEGLPQELLIRINSPQPGSLDTGFNPQVGNGMVYDMARQRDGKIIIVGSFTSVQGITRNRIARLNRDGSLDRTFHEGLGGANQIVHAVLVQDDDKILLGGQFSTVNGFTRHRVARLNDDGGMDGAFAPPNVSDPTSQLVRALAIHEGNILIGGTFTQVGTMNRPYLARLQGTTGDLDTTFLNQMSGPGNVVNAIAVQADGRILIGGAFLTVTGYTRGYFARLLGSGAVDEDFVCNASHAVWTISLQPDQNILLGGIFTQVKGVTRNRIARVTPQGNLDTEFTPGAGAGTGIVYRIAAEPTGNIVLGGTFTTYAGVVVNRFARITSTGALIPPGTGQAGASGEVRVVRVLPDGTIMAGGAFESFHAATAERVARVLSPLEMQLVKVTHPGNAPHANGYGAVPYEYEIGKHEVTHAEYAVFLNAVAWAADPQGLYHTSMGSHAQGGIIRDGSAGAYVYTVKAGHHPLPVGFIARNAAVRFTNWMHNGAVPGAAFNEGTYDVGTANPLPLLRVSGARYYLPSHHEWVKAGHYNPAGSGGYSTIPTGSNTDPVPEPPPGGGNSANLAGGNANVRTQVGAYTLTRSYFGGHDFAGNLWEFLEDVTNDGKVVIRGGAYNTVVGWSRIGNFQSAPVAEAFVNYGFRVARRRSPVWETPMGVTLTVGVAGSIEFSAAGATGYAATGLPDGVAIDAVTGVVSGTPAKAGVFHSIIIASNSDGEAHATATFTVQKGLAMIALSNLTQTYNGLPREVAYTFDPAQPDWVAAVTYGGADSAPVNAGTYQVVATLVNDDWEAVATGTLVVEKASQTIDFPAPAAVVFGALPFLPDATASSGLPVAFQAVGGPAVAENGLFRVGVGTVVFQATQSGDINYLAASAVNRSMVVHPPLPDLISGTQITAGMGQDIDHQIRVRSYSVSVVPANWEQAAKNAELAGSRLVTVSGGAVQSLLEERFMSGANDQTPYWIGLYDTVKNGVNPRTFAWHSGAPFVLGGLDHFHKWKTGEPNNHNNTGEWYVVANWDRARSAANPKGTWNDAPLAGSTGFGGFSNGPYLAILEHLPPATPGTYSAVGLPPFVELNSATGRIVGTALEPGDFPFGIEAHTPAGSVAYHITLQITGQTFAQWLDNLREEDQPPPDQRGPLDIPLGDDMNNLMKYALGGKPLDRAQDLLPQLLMEAGPDGNYMTFQYRRRRDAADLIFEEQLSKSLQSWHFDEALLERMIVHDSEETEIVRVTHTTPIGETEYKYIRLHVRTR